MLHFHLFKNSVTRSRSKRQFQPSNILAESGAKLEDRFLAVYPTYLLNQPNPGLGLQMGLIGQPPIVFQTDNSNGFMQVLGNLVIDNTDFFNGAPPGYEFHAHNSAETHVQNAGNPTTAAALSVAAAHLDHVWAVNPEGECGTTVRPGVFSTIGTDQFGGGTVPISWGIVDEATGNPYTEDVYLRGHIEIKFQFTGDAGVAAFAFGSTATGVVAGIDPNGRDLIVTVPDGDIPGTTNPYFVTTTYEDFFVNGGGVAIDYMRIDHNPGAGESIAYTSTTAEFAFLGDVPSSDATLRFEYSFTEAAALS